MPKRRELDPTQLAALENSILKNLFRIPMERCPELEGELFIHATHRLTEFRNNVIPWLAEQIPLEAARVLEIGAGTGASIVALAEVCQWVDGIDILEKHLTIAQDRVALHELTNVNLTVSNATDFPFDSAPPYDLILFSAVLEHMTYEERLQALRQAWANLQMGGYLCIYETPNRLWFYDGHTSLLNFFHWLPEPYAVLYSQKSPRSDFADLMKDGDQIKLARWGRGVSFHEVELAIGKNAFHVGKSLHHFLCEQHPHYRANWDASLGKRYFELLSEIAGEIPPPYFEELLNIVIQKRS